MTTESVAGELVDGAVPLSLTRILDLCDGLLGEFGRRRHLFAWLRAPGGGPEDWLEVAAYYPANRLVLVWRERPGPHDHVYSELVPMRGLRLLELTPHDLGGDPETALQAKIAALGAAPGRAWEQPLAPRLLSRAVASPVPPVKATPRRDAIPRRVAQPRPPASTGAGVALGLVLAAAVLVELFIGVTSAGLGGGRLVLAFGLALDACARALGTIAAGRDGAAGWAWWCALGGSPFVASFALFGSEGPVSVEPAPLAGRLSLLAIAVLVLALLVAVI